MEQRNTRSRPQARHDDDHDDELNAWIANAQGMAQAKAAKVAQPTGRNQKIVAAAFEQLVDDHGRPNPGGTGFPEAGAVKVLDLERLVEFASGKVVGSSASEKRKNIRDAINSLTERRYFVINEGLIWRRK